MTIQIGKKSLAISRAGDFEERLLESTGCNVAEWAGFMAGNPTAGQIARVLSPMLIDPVPVDDLAHAINDADADQVRLDVLALLTDAPAPAKPKAAKRPPAQKRKAAQKPAPVTTPVVTPPATTGGEVAAETGAVTDGGA